MVTQKQLPAVVEGEGPRTVNPPAVRSLLARVFGEAEHRHSYGWMRSATEHVRDVERTQLVQECLLEDLCEAFDAESYRDGVTRAKAALERARELDRLREMLREQLGRQDVAWDPQDVLASIDLLVGPESDWQRRRRRLRGLGVR